MQGVLSQVSTAEVPHMSHPTMRARTFVIQLKRQARDGGGRVFDPVPLFVHLIERPMCVARRRSR